MMTEGRVLVVEDEAIVAEVVERYLRRDGYDVEIVHDGKAALEQFQTFAPDLVVLDLMLPKIDGREVWTSDFDRSGWQPGLVVEPLLVPVPELTPGRHEITLEVLGIRPGDRDHAHGYWRISGVVLADEPWPAPAAP